MNYVPSGSRYEGIDYRRCGESGLSLPPISLGTWQNFGGVNVFETCRAIVRRAFDRGVTHFDLANMYGPPYGSAEENFGEILRKDFCRHRDELVISTKAGYEMWPGPYGIGASKKYLIASIDHSLKRLGVDYVDIFYAHRPWPHVPMEETIGALAQIVRQGKALYIGISSYSPERTERAFELLKAEELVLKSPAIDILVNNVGFYTAKDFQDISDADWEQIMNLNFMSGVRLSRAYLPGMKSTGWGRVIFISSEAGVKIPREMIHYGVSKTAQIALSRGMAETTTGTNVTVNSVLVGPTRSEGVEAFIKQMVASRGVTEDQVVAEFFKTVRPTSIIKRFIGPQEVAALVAYLCSPLAAAITGAAVRIDGGVVPAIP